MKRLLQFYEKFGERVDDSELEETVSLAIGGLKERFEVKETEESSVRLLDIEFKSKVYLFSSELGSVRFSRVIALHPQEYKGDQEEFGVGLEGMGRRVETAVFEGDSDFVEDLEIEIESAFGEYGAGLLPCSVDDFLRVADEAQVKKKNPLWFIDYIHCALRLEASKGPLMDPDRYESLRLRFVDSLSNGVERGVFGNIRDAYEILRGKYVVLKRKFGVLKDEH